MTARLRPTSGGRWTVVDGKLVRDEDLEAAQAAAPAPAPGDTEAAASDSPASRRRNKKHED